MQYFKVHHFHFSHRRKTNVLSSLPIRITNLNKQRLFLELKKIFFAISAAQRTDNYCTMFLTSLTSTLTG